MPLCPLPLLEAPSIPVVYLHEPDRQRRERSSGQRDLVVDHEEKETEVGKTGDGIDDRIRRTVFAGTISIFAVSFFDTRHARREYP